MTQGMTTDRVAAAVHAFELQAVLVSYFDRVDADDPVGAAAHFAPDVEVEIMTGKRLVGRDRYARALGRVLDQYERTSHHVGNVRVTVDGDAATMVAYVYAYHRMRSTGEPWHLWARVHERLERREDRWVVTEHLLRGVDAVPHRDDLPAEWYPGHAGRVVRNGG